MATTTKALARTAATTNTGTTLYTTPAGSSAVVTNIVVSNTAGSSSTVTIGLNGVNLIPTTSIAANTVAMFDIKQVIAATQTITGGASTTAVNIHISGVEIA
jgi:hypothetical protein